MAIHTELQIYRDAFELLDVAESAIVQMPRGAKTVVGAQILADCLGVMTQISRANRSRERRPQHLDALLDRVQSAEVLFRLSWGKRYIPPGRYGRLMLLTVKIGKQANAWRKSSQPAA